MLPVWSSRVLLVAESAAESSAAIVLRWVAVALFFLAALATVLAVTGIVLERRADRLRSGQPSDSVAVSAPAAPVSGAVRLVVLDPLTVLYQQSLNVEVYVLPFVRDQHGSARTDTVLDACKALREGSLDATELWQACGLSGTRDRLDELYISGRTMAPEAAAFLAEMQRRRIPVAAISHDVASWSGLTRDRDNLSAIWPWLVSSPDSDRQVFGSLHSESGVAYEHCLYVGARSTTLDIAKDLGMKTALFDAGQPGPGHDSNHARVTNFDELLDL